jgi:hypothetical protein
VNPECPSCEVELSFFCSHCEHHFSEEEEALLVKQELPVDVRKLIAQVVTLFERITYPCQPYDSAWHTLFREKLHELMLKIESPQQQTDRFGMKQAKSYSVISQFSFTQTAAIVVFAVQM